MKNTGKTEQTTRNSSTYINRNWRIKVSGFTGTEKVHKLIGYHKLVEILGARIVDSIIDTATDGGADKTIFKFRRGLKVTLYSK